MTDKEDYWCCYLRHAPPGLSSDTHYTYNQVMDAIKRQKWYPRHCYYCESFIPLSRDDYEFHVIKDHLGELCYPGPAPSIIVRLLEAIEGEERRKKYWKTISIGTGMGRPKK